jgi:hypothetical protein
MYVVAGGRRLVPERVSRASAVPGARAAACASRLKDAVDLDSVREDLAAVVQKALERVDIQVCSTNAGETASPQAGTLLYVIGTTRRWRRSPHGTIAVQVDADALATAQADAPTLGLSGNPAELVREGLRLLHQYAVDWKAAQADPEWAATEDQHTAS